VNFNEKWIQANLKGLHKAAVAVMTFKNKHKNKEKNFRSLSSLV